MHQQSLHLFFKIKIKACHLYSKVGDSLWQLVKITQGSWFNFKTQAIFFPRHFRFSEHRSQNMATGSLMSLICTTL